MLGSLRKFSSSIYAKILLGIIVIPFVFWVMGSSFKGGSKNIIVVIEKDKYTVEEFVNFIQKFATPNKKITPGQVESFLSEFIGEKLIEKEIQHFGIKLSDDSLAKFQNAVSLFQLIFHQRTFHLLSKNRKSFAFIFFFERFSNTVNYI
jgi:peptidyl-prolyl cis-trans isomerase D